MIDPLDPRRNAIRDDLADIRLRDRVVRPSYAVPEPMVIAAPVVPCLRAPGGEAVDTEFLCGEAVDLFAAEGGVGADGWAWVQSAVDGYVGYVPIDTLVGPGAGPTHRVAVPLAVVYPVASIKRGVLGTLPLGAAVRVAEEVSGSERFARLEGEGPERFVLMRHLRPVEASPPADFVAVAEWFQGVPYVWGGKSWSGIDCSGLVQLAVQAAGRAAPRDSDMQAAELGEPLGQGDALRRGDLVFWKGHVGMMVDEARLLHANGHHMMTAIEPLADALERLSAMGLEVTVRRRLVPCG